MMGSLPLSSWLLCLVWLAFGIAVYFAYGIHHSTLGKSGRYSETAPLLAVLDETVVEDGYQSTLNVSLRPTHHVHS